MKRVTVIEVITCMDRNGSGFVLEIVQKRCLHDDVLEIVRKAILHDEVPPNSRLQKLHEALSCSTPYKCAHLLNQLHSNKERFCLLKKRKVQWDLFDFQLRGFGTGKNHDYFTAS